MSGSLSSDVENINKICFSPFPSKRKLNIDKLVRIEHAIYAVGCNGSIYTNTRLCTRWYPRYANPDHCVEALEKLGVITSEEAKVHLDYVKSHRERSDQGHIADRIVDNAKLLGLKLTKAQERKLQQIEKVRYD